MSNKSKDFSNLNLDGFTPLQSSMKKVQDHATDSFLNQCKPMVIPPPPITMELPIYRAPTCVSTFAQHQCHAQIQFQRDIAKIKL